MLQQNTKLTFILMASVATSALSFSGCRSIPGAGMFGMRGEPSAETLAGSGPTVTYPAPPSTSATPTAIASVAGGTAQPTSGVTSGARSTPTSQLAGYEMSPGNAKPSANMAAAQANGFQSNESSPVTSTLTDNDGRSELPSSYSLGSKALMPTTSATGQTLAGGTPIASPKSPLTTPSTTSSFAPPPITEPAARSAGIPSGTGFTLPTDSPSFSSITPPKTSMEAVTPAGSGDLGAISSIMPPATATIQQPSSNAASAPSFSTASAATGYTAPTTTPVLPSSVPTGESGSQGYGPGSTGNASGYPAYETRPTTNGSFYR